MPASTITARTLFTGVDTIEYPVVTLGDDGRIVEISSNPHSNATGTLAPALFDIHTHGALGHDVMSASPADLGEMQRFLAQHGVSCYLPTTVTASIDTTLHALDHLADAIERAPAPGEATPVGIHLEGPFLSHAKRGVHPADLLLQPTPALLDRFRAAARGHIRLITLAPELPGALETIAHARQLGIRVSLGHSDANASEALAAIDAGATSATHTFNAMRGLNHREPGLLGVVLDDARLFAELICDGIHVAPEIVRLWWKCIGPERGILITDAMSAAGMPDGQYALAGLSVSVRNRRAVLTEELSAGKEVLAGSLLTMDQAIANFRRITGASIIDTIALAARNPARMLGQPDLTTVRTSAPANLIRLDDNGHLADTWIAGQHIASL